MSRRDGLNKQGVPNLNGRAPAPSNGVPVVVVDSAAPTQAVPFREEIMEHFTFDHLPAGPMREMSQMFAGLAEHVHETAPRTAERSVALRKLLEGKDAAVRAVKPRRR